MGLVLEAADINTDNVRGVGLVGASAALGVLASLLYTRSEADLERAERVRLTAWTLVRFFLAFELMRYGAAKIVGMQFYPRYYQLDARSLDLKPMAVAWTFFGRSYGYQAFGGAMEIAAAALFCFRRTTTLAGCIALTVLGNVVLVDFFYDVPVKLFASVYFVMTLYVLSWDARRFWRFFVGDGATEARAYLAQRSAGARAPTRIAEAAVVAVVLGLPAAEIGHKAIQRRVFTRDRLEGIWRVDAREGLDDLLPTAPGPWDRLYFEKGDYGFVRVGGQRLRFTFHADPATQRTRIVIAEGEAARVLDARLSTDDGAVTLDGSREGAPFSVKLRRDYPL